MKLLVIVLAAGLLVSIRGLSDDDSPTDSIETVTHKVIRDPSSEPDIDESLERTVDLNLSKIKGRREIRGKVTFRQFSGKVRIEFEGWGLPKGNYAILSVQKCSLIKIGKAVSLKTYKALGSELHNFLIESTGVSTERSSAEISLKKGDKGYIGDDSIAFFRFQKTKITPLDCQGPLVP